MARPAGSKGTQYLYLTTTGRRTGRPREIEIWFTQRGGCYYLVAEHREHAHWVQNLKVAPRVAVRVGRRAFPALARVVDARAEPELARAAKGSPRRNTVGATDSSSSSTRRGEHEG